MNAFPCHPDTPSSYDGMSLRDYFAAKAMQALISISSETPHDYVAIDSYSYADAMMNAREQA